MDKHNYILWTIVALTAAIAAASPVFTSNAAINLYAGIFFAVLLFASPLLYETGQIITFRFVKKKAASFGAQIKSLDVLAALRQIDAVVFIRPKLLLEGRPLITDIVGINGMEQDRLLLLAATIEEGAAHPIGRAIYYAAAKRGLTELYRRTSFVETTFGAQANLNGTVFRVGDISWVEEEFAMQVPAVMATRADQLAYHGKIPVIIVGGGITRGLIALKDDVNKMAVETVKKLNELGFVTRFLGNEPKRFAASIERETDIPIQNGLKPLAMIREIQLMRAKGSFVAVVGSKKNEKEIYWAGDLSVIVGSPTIINREDAIPTATESTTTENAADQPQNTSPQPNDFNDDFKADIILWRDLYSLIPIIELSHTTENILRFNHVAALFVSAIGTLFSCGASLVFNWPLLPLPGAVAFIALTAALMWFNTHRLINE